MNGKYAIWIIKITTKISFLVVFILLLTYCVRIDNGHYYCYHLRFSINFRPFFFSNEKHYTNRVAFNVYWAGGCWNLLYKFCTHIEPPRWKENCLTKQSNSQEMKQDIHTKRRVCTRTLYNTLTKQKEKKLFMTASNLYSIRSSVIFVAIWMGIIHGSKAIEQWNKFSSFVSSINLSLISFHSSCYLLIVVTLVCFDLLLDLVIFSKRRRQSK